MVAAASSAAMTYPLRCEHEDQADREQMQRDQDDAVHGVVVEAAI